MQLRMEKENCLTILNIGIIGLNKPPTLRSARHPFGARRPWARHRRRRPKRWQWKTNVFSCMTSIRCGACCSRLAIAYPTHTHDCQPIRIDAERVAFEVEEEWKRKRVTRKLIVWSRDIRCAYVASRCLYVHFDNLSVAAHTMEPQTWKRPTRMNRMALGAKKTWKRKRVVCAIKIATS